MADGTPGPGNETPGARPYRSHKIPACDFCRRRKSRCDRVRLKEPCSLCRTHERDCTTAADDTETVKPRRSTAYRPRPRKTDRSWVVSSPASTPVATENNIALTQDPQGAAFGSNRVENAANTMSPLATATGLSSHIIGPALARDAQMLEQFMSPRDDIAESHVHPNPYSVYSNDPRNPVVYMKVPRQRGAISSGNGTPGFKQCEVIDKILEPLGPSLVELYFDIIHPPFPILDETAVRKAYQQGVLPHTLVCEIYAVMLVYWGLSDNIAGTKRPVPDVRYIWNLAVSAMHEDFLSPSFSTVLACILDLLGRPITSITYNAVNVGSSVALAQSLGLNRNPSNWNLDPRQKNLRIKTWWGLLIHDHWGSLSHGTPGHIHGDQWDVALPDITTILDDAPANTSTSVSEVRLRGAHSFIALCRLTRILGNVLSVVYSLRDEPVERTLKTLRRQETAIDDWQDSLPAWLNPGRTEFERDQPGSLNLRLSFLAVKMCICRVALQATRVSDQEEALYHQSRCIKSGNALIDFVVSLSVDETRVFWLPYTAYHFASAATLMMRCALEAQTDGAADKCVTSARKLIDYLRKMKTDTNWDLADICLGQCETTVKQMSHGGYVEFRRRNNGIGRPRQGQSQSQPPRPAHVDHTLDQDNNIDAEAEIDEGMPLVDGALEANGGLDDWQEHMPENFYFPDLWQVSYADFQRWTWT